MDQNETKQISNNTLSQIESLNNGLTTKNSSVSKEYYEMYYDATQKAPYFYNPKTGTSVWQLPEGAM